MKKKICSFMLACCVIFASAFALISCGKKHNKAKDWSSDDTNHWKICLDEGCDKVYDLEEHDFTETIIEPTIDADGKSTKTCSVCSKVVETVIPKIQQTKAEMIDVLVQAVKAENYSGEVQEEYTKKMNTENYYTALDNEVVTYETNCITESGTAVSFKKDSSLGTEAVTSGKFWFKENENYVEHSFKLNAEKNAVIPDKKLIVGQDYSKRYIQSQVMSNLDYLLEITSEETAQSVLKNILNENVKRYQEKFAIFGDEFTYDEDDIQVNFDIFYENGRYTAQGTIELNEINYDTPLTTKTVDSFKVDFVVVYTENYVVQNYSRFSYLIDDEPVVIDNELTEIYIEENYIYEVRGVNVELIVEAANIVESLTYGAAEIGQERVKYYIDDILFSFEDVNFNEKINTKVDEFVDFYATNQSLPLSRIEVYLDSEHTIEYDPAVDVFAEDYYGKSIYIVILPQN